MKKLLSILSLVSVMACGGHSAVQPSAPPAIAPQEIKVDKPLVVSDEMTEYKGDTWSVKIPADFKKVENPSLALMTKHQDQSIIVLSKSASQMDLNTASFVFKQMMIDSGTAFVLDKDVSMGNFSAKLMIFKVPGNHQVAAVSIAATSTNVYFLMYVGAANHDRGQMFKKVMDTVNINEIPTNLK